MSIGPPTANTNAINTLTNANTTSVLLHYYIKHQAIKTEINKIKIINEIIQVTFLGGNSLVCKCLQSLEYNFLETFLSQIEEQESFFRLPRPQKPPHDNHCFVQASFSLSL